MFIILKMSIFDVRCARFKKQEDEAKDGEQVNYCKKTKFKQTSILLYIYIDSLSRKIIRLQLVFHWKEQNKLILMLE